MVAPGPEAWLTALTRALASVNANGERSGVLHALASAVVEEFDAALARIWLYDPLSATLLFSAEAGLASDELASSALSPRETPAIITRAFSGHKIVAVDELRAADWAAGFTSAEAQGLHGYAAFPLLVDERVIGVLGAALRGPWPPLMLQAIGALVQQSALALDHARVIEQTHTLQAVAADLAQAVDLEALLDGIVRQTATALNADGCVVWLINPDTQNPLRRVTFGLSDTFTRAIEQPHPSGLRGRGPWQQVRDTGKALFTRDEYGRALAEGDRLAEAFAAEGIVSCGRLPLREPGGRLLGMLLLYHRSERVYTENEERLAQAFTDQIAIAVHRAHIAAREQAAQALEHSRQLLRSRDAAILEERTRLARELHDSVSQALFGITLGASSLKQALESRPEQVPKLVDYVLSLAHTGQTEMRALLYELGPEAMGTEGVVAALEKQAAALGARYELRVATAFCTEPPLSLEAKHDLYRIAQESLHNVVKHAQAHRVELTLVQDAQVLLLTVRDDGVGFDPVAARDGHYGQQSLRERASRLGARLQLSSAPGKGTTVRVSVPLPVPANTEHTDKLLDQRDS